MLIGAQALAKDSMLKCQHKESTIVATKLSFKTLHVHKAIQPPYFATTW